MLHLVLVGGGHAMLPTLRAAKTWQQTKNVRVTLIDASQHLYYSGMVPEYLGGVYPASRVRIDLAAECRRSGVAFRHDTVTAFDPETRTVTTAGGDALAYDLLALDVGGVNPHRPDGDVIPTKPIYAVQALDARLRAVLDDPTASLRMALVGAGAAGIEIGLNVTGRFHAAGRADDLALTLVEAGPDVLPGFPASLQAHVRRLLQRRGATLRLADRVTGVRDGRIRFADGTDRPTDAVVWATGSVGGDLLRDSGLPTGPDGFLRVTPALHSPRDARVFAAGDCASVLGYEGLRRIGVHAIKQGVTLRTNLAQALDQLQASPPSYDATAIHSFADFRPYPVAPLILSTGAPHGIWTAGAVWVDTGWALRLKHWIDRRWIRDYHDTWASEPLLRLLDRASAGARA